MVFGEPLIQIRKRLRIPKEEVQIDGREEHAVAKCDKKCFKCQYADCINDRVTAMDFLDIVDLEKEVGVYQPEDEKWFVVELEYYVRRDRRREKNAELKRMERGA